MCRIAVLPPGYKGPKIVALLNHLEKSLGGDGNGFGWFDSEGTAQIVKGLKVPNRTINGLETGASMVLYHTRKTSAGSTSDDNTQPFLTRDGEKKSVILCHNGTWSTHTDYKKILLMLEKIDVLAYKDWSDTRLMAWMMENQGADRLALPEVGVWILHYGAYAIAHIKTGEFSACKVGKKWIYASEFPATDYPKIWKFKSDSIVMLSADGGFKVLVGPKPTLEDNKSYAWSGAIGGSTSYYGVKAYIYENGQRKLLSKYGSGAPYGSNWGY